MEKLIQLVKSRPFLYDNRNVNFKNRDTKMEGWNEIAEIMGTESGNYWRFKWNCLKENYSKYKKVYSNPLNQTYRKYRNWPWAKHMRFMDDFPNNRKIKGNRNIKCAETIHEEISFTDVTGSDKSLMNNMKKEGEAKFQDELSEFLEVSKNNGNFIENQVYLVEKVSSGDENPDIPVEDIQVIIQGDNDTSNCSPKRKTNSNGLEGFSDYREKRRRKNEFGEVEHFFMSYAHTFKRLPTRLQQVVKLEMMTLFARYELEAEILERNT